ncbi:MAG: tRNA (adenosine(37)-N6)-threonylcarbamoyltransferase complex dimerization subunit type 1 TsaB [Verrucomicrobiota bacterium]|nr:tRNA (adenosine(37)-N6)-threonylcarbamoyltransferase complex dimerization subunit type 1 TsaB [Verrucomicrobiota bacterium]MCC6820513.1 tRNA (adenosine(37)-N6)-threonylcarbamoyltransferase complex dimerization subunit type 1 TsaB [Limisphaerales bacterium]
MKLLALEFSSVQRSVAVVVAGADGRPLATGEVVETATGHGMKPFALIEEALRAASVEREQIEVIAVGLGPGSYTGIRAAIALAQGWQLATGVKLLGVSSAEGVAAQVQTDGLTGKFSVVIDAQREEFYVADYEFGPGGMRAVAPLRLGTLAEVREREGAGERLVGPEVARWFPKGRVVFPRAVRLGERAVTRNDFVAGEKLEPIYLRATAFVKALPSRVIPA